MRIRVTFHKTEAMRFTGHLDLHKTWERTIRRAKLPLAYSQGFHPQPRINLASALPLGFTSDYEIADLWLQEDIPIAEVQSKLEKALPPGIRVTTLEIVDPSAPSLQTQVVSADYSVTFFEPYPHLEKGILDLLAATSLPRTRRGKQYDLRPLIEALEQLPDDAEGQPRIRVQLAAREGATGRPEEVVAALGIAPTEARYHRTALVMVEATPVSSL